MTTLRARTVWRRDKAIPGSFQSQSMKRKEAAMNIKIRSIWLLMAAMSLIALAAVACAQDDAADNEPAGSNQQDIPIGAPADIVTGIGSVGESFPVSSSSYSEPAVPAIAPYPDGFSSAQGFSASYGGANSSLNGIWVNGTATVNVPADIAKISLGVESREETVSAARQAAAQAMDQVIAELKALGVAEDDIVTTSFNIHPQTTWVEVSDSLGRHSEPRIIGYVVSNSVQVTVRDIDGLGEVVDSAAEAGGNLIRVNSISFTVADPSEFGEEIRQAAAADALAKADIYARAMGTSLGQLVYLSEIGSYAPVSVNYARAESAAFDGGFAPTPFNAGEASLSVTVQAVFAIN